MRIKSQLRTAFAFGLPFGHTRGDNPSFRFSARTFRATRPNARSAREINVGRFFEPFATGFLLIPRLIAEQNLHH
jgi:hypothetical protein